MSIAYLKQNVLNAYSNQTFPFEDVSGASIRMLAVALLKPPNEGWFLLQLKIQAGATN